MAVESFQMIFDRIAQFLPSGWDSVVFYAEYTDSSYSMEFYVRNQNGQYVKCYDLANVSHDALFEQFLEIDKFLDVQRKRLEQSKRWSNLTMIVRDDGKVKIDYGYGDPFEEGAYARRKEWKLKYLM